MTVSKAKTAPAAAKPQFMQHLFYGRVVVKHYDQDITVELAGIISRALPPGTKVYCQWIEHKDGVETLDSEWDGKKWAAPARTDR